MNHIKVMGCVGKIDVPASSEAARNLDAYKLQSPIGAKKNGIGSGTSGLGTLRTHSYSVVSAIRRTVASTRKAHLDNGQLRSREGDGLTRMCEGRRVSMCWPKGLVNGKGELKTKQRPRPKETYCRHVLRKGSV